MRAGILGPDARSGRCDMGRRRSGMQLRAFLANLTLILAACGRDAAPAPIALVPPALLPSACTVHGTPLRTERVPIVYGRLEDGYAAYQEAKRAEFPFHGLMLFGGCVPGKSPWATTLVCEQCRAGALAWEQARAAEGQPFSSDVARRAAYIAWAETIEPRGR